MWTVFFNTSSKLDSKVCCVVEPETSSVNFSHSVTFKSIGLCSTGEKVLDLFTRAWLCNILSWSFGKYRFIDVCRFFQMTHFIKLYPKSHIHQYHCQSEKSLSIGKLSSSWWIQVFQNPNVYSKLQMSSLSTPPVIFLKWQACFIYFQENIYKISNLNNHSFSVHKSHK